METCRKCIIPDSYPDITFEDGLCAFCRMHERSPRLNKSPLGRDKLLEKLTSKPIEKYHCVVALSGGKDSSYVLLHLVKELGLRPLAVCVDSGYMSYDALANVRRICETLSVDLVIHKSRFRWKLAREAFRIWQIRGECFTPCMPCELSNRSVAINQALRQNIPFIVWGASDYEEEAPTFLEPESLTFRQRYASKVDTSGMTLYARLKRFVMADMGFGHIHGALKSSMPLRKKLKTAYHMAMYLYYSLRNNLDVSAPEGWRRYLPIVETSFENKGIEPVYFFDYVDYNPSEHIETLRREVGWKAPVAKETRLDCRVHAIIAYKHLKETGITSEGFTYSVLVRHGLLSREEAAEKEEIFSRDLKKDCEQVLAGFGIDDKEGVIV